MQINQNEKYLLKFISCANNDTQKSNSLLDVISDFGIGIEFKGTNPVYQIIDEMYYSKYCKQTVGKE